MGSLKGRHKQVVLTCLLVKEKNIAWALWRDFTRRSEYLTWVLAKEMEVSVAAEIKKEVKGKKCKFDGSTERSQRTNV